MISNLIATYKRVLGAVVYAHHRYIYQRFNIDDRLTGLIGPRGTGKTTLLLQFIKEQIADKDSAIYVSMDNIYFLRHSLLDCVNELYEVYGVRYFFLDEVHKYKTWNQELKNIYDSYPDIKVIFSGSSSIDLVKGSYDLSRRGTLFHMNGLSFREYLLFHDIADIPSVSLQEIMTEHRGLSDKIGSIKKLKGHFKDYLGHGYYPFHLEGIGSYNQKLQRIIDKSVYEDISNFYSLKTENLSYFKLIMTYLATIPPGELNRNNIAKKIGVDNKTVMHYLNILYETGLVELISEDRAGSNILKRKEKIYLDNCDLYMSLSEGSGFPCQYGTLREIFFIKMIQGGGNKIFYSKVGDFSVGTTLFEVGGKGKSLKQIKGNLQDAFIVKDDILHGSRHEIPLYLFGFLY